MRSLVDVGQPTLYNEVVAKSTVREDVHSPTNLVTEDYDYVGAYDNSPPPGSYIGSVQTFDYDGVKVEGLRGLLKASKTARYGDGFQCDHCGARIRYVGVLVHKPSGDHIAVGEVCLDNRFSRATVDFQKLRKQAKLDRERVKIEEAAAAYRIDHPEVVWAALDESPNTFVQDVLSKLTKWGSISDKQLEAIQRAVIRDEERADKKAAESLIPKADVVTGSGVVVIGEVVSTKWVDNQFGGALKMLVRVETPQGVYKLWGTVPSSLTVVSGDMVTFTANVEVSDKDSDFGFFKRPRKASKVG